ncbi:putative rmlC-like jelly roll protein [Rosa chinensis]|uniref:Putative rmlC-like jelly roll protein n=2 Tax=Rosa TaxID=3764 RepID=A0A2P6P791_ROSCH|nr:putative rmlC-like jelly roll protein [Rosa chinensis]
MVAKLAGEKGMECFSVITSSQAVLEDLTDKTSVLRALSPEVLQISLNINPQLQTLLQSNIN